MAVRIDRFSFGEIVVNGKTYYNDLTIWWDGTKDVRQKKHLFDVDEFVHLLMKDPEVVVVGCGESGMMKVDEAVRELAERKNVELFVESSPKAVQIFNAFVKDNRKVVAVIHSTC